VWKDQVPVLRVIAQISWKKKLNHTSTTFHIKKEVTKNGRVP
jgi:hypothetical protein